MDMKETVAMTDAHLEAVIDAIHEANLKRGATKEDVARAAIVAVLEGVRDGLISFNSPEALDALIAQHKGGRDD